MTRSLPLLIDLHGKALLPRSKLASAHRIWYASRWEKQYRHTGRAR